KQVGAEVNRYRVIAAHVEYVPPPPQQRTLAGQSLPRLEPTTVTSDELMSAAAAGESSGGAVGKKARQQATGEPKLWQLLTKHLLGFSALLAREAVYRSTGDTETLANKGAQDEARWEALAWNVHELSALYDTHVWQPQLVFAPIAERGDAPVPIA